MCLRGFACFLCRVITYTLPRTLQLYAGYSLFRVAFYAGCLFLRRSHFSSFFSSCVLLQLTAGCYFTQDALLTQSFTVQPITMLSMSRFFCCNSTQDSFPLDRPYISMHRYYFNLFFLLHFTQVTRRLFGLLSVESLQIICIKIKLTLISLQLYAGLRESIFLSPAVVIFRRLLSHAEFHCKTSQELVAIRAGQCCHFTQGLLYI